MEGLTPELVCRNYSNKRYQIPIYQRLFEWDQEKIEQLLNDLYISYKKDETEPYYVGMLTSTIDGEDLAEGNNLVDGQQRFTVIFTGDTETGYGKPDITIKFANNFYYYIEVKTRFSTGFQENQVNSKYGYSRLIKDNNQILEESLGYLLDNNHDTTPCLTRNIVLWQNILELVEDFNNPTLAKDIKQINIIVFAVGKEINGSIIQKNLVGPESSLNFRILIGSCVSGLDFSILFHCLKNLFPVT